MTHTGASVHHVVFDARRNRFEGAVAIGDAPDFKVSVPGHQSWPYRKIAKAMITAGHIRSQSANEVRHDNS